MKYIKDHILESILGMLVGVIVLLSALFFCIDQVWSNSNDDKLFSNYYSNMGIRLISTAKFFTVMTYLGCFLHIAINNDKRNPFIKFLYLTSALLIGFLQWYELYHGSTFYYGEVRDKQGLWFPFIASCMATLVIWKLKYSTDENRNMFIKICITVVLNIGLYILWRAVYEPWKLWQS